MVQGGRVAGGKVGEEKGGASVAVFTRVALVEKADVWACFHFHSIR